MTGGMIDEQAIDINSSEQEVNHVSPNIKRIEQPIVNLTDPFSAWAWTIAQCRKEDYLLGLREVYMFYSFEKTNNEA